MSENENDFNQQPSEMWRPPASDTPEAPGVGSPTPGPAADASAGSETPAPSSGGPTTPQPAAHSAPQSDPESTTSAAPGAYPTAIPAEPTVPTTQIPAYGPYAGSAPAPNPAISEDAPTTDAGAGWATSAYPMGGYGQSAKQRKGGAGKYIAAGVLAVALAAGGGLAGALITHNLDKTGSVTGTSATVVSNAPIVDRSSLASIAAAVRPSVVSITTSNAEGSGVVLSADGYILTNNHVAATAHGADVNITFSTGKSAKAKLVGTDPKTDLAVFKAQGVSGLSVAKFGDSSALQVGDTVLAIGSPLGLDGSVTSGIISALNRTIDESADSQPQNPFDQNQSSQSSSGTTIAGAIQTDAAINPGNSGGALVNTNGEVIGINTAIATSGSGSEGNIGVGFAIPANKAKQVVDDIIAGKSVSHPQLGVEVTTADNNAGALVRTVGSGTAADKAGIKTGDVITAFNGTAVHTSEDLINDVQGSDVNKAVTITVNRNGQTVTLNATLLESK